MVVGGRLAPNSFFGEVRDQVRVNYKKKTAKDKRK
jgi:hypothetical protein